MASPSVLTDDFASVLSSTLRNYESKMADNISRGNKLCAWLDSKGRWTTKSGGERIQIPLMHAQNNTADIYSGYGLLDTTPQEGITSAFYEWSQLSVSITISELEIFQNGGKSRIFDLLNAKIMQAEVSGKELLNNCIVAGYIAVSGASGSFTRRVGRLDTSAKGPLPLAAIIDITPTRSRTDIGNINPNTYGFWANQANSSTATTFAGYKQELNNSYNDCAKGTGGSPDLFVSDQVAWETYWNSLQSQERYVVDDKRTLDVLGGSEALKFRGAAWIWDEVCPDTETNAEVVDAVGTHTVSTVFMINSQTLEFVTGAGKNWKTTPFVRPENQDARVAQAIWYGALTCNNRRKNGQLYGISKSITA